MKVICKLPNASEFINGVAFKTRGELMLSEDVAPEVAAAFAEIPGYEVLPAAPVVTELPAAPVADAPPVAKKRAKESAIPVA